MNFHGVFRSLLAPAAERGLAGRFDQATICWILDETFAEYEAEQPALPREDSVGGRLMVHLAALTIALYHAILRREQSPDQARRLTAGVTWRAYEKMATLPTILSRVGSPAAGVKRATRLFRRFPFSPPAYRMEDVEVGDDIVAFDVHRCPVAEHFRAQGLGELCVESWCNLDYALARAWGARLERPQTIAGGDTHCDFRWIVPPHVS